MSFRSCVQMVPLVYRVKSNSSLPLAHPRALTIPLRESIFLIGQSKGEPALQGRRRVLFPVRVAPCGGSGPVCVLGVCVLLYLGLMDQPHAFLGDCYPHMLVMSSSHSLPALFLQTSSAPCQCIANLMSFLLFFLINNPLSPVGAASVCLSAGPSTGSLDLCQ